MLVWDTIFVYTWARDDLIICRTTTGNLNPPSLIPKPLDRPGNEASGYDDYIPHIIHTY